MSDMDDREVRMKMLMESRGIPWGSKVPVVQEVIEAANQDQLFDPSTLLIDDNKEEEEVEPPVTQTEAPSTTITEDTK